VLGLALALGGGCGEKSLEVKGALDRVIGETITLELTQGEKAFNGELTLRAADNTSFKGADLKLDKKSDRLLSFSLPPGIAAGSATAQLGRSGDGSLYEVTLHVNRLLLTLDEKGTLESWPLAPATLGKSSQSVGTAGGRLAISNAGGEAALAASDQVRLLGLGPEVKDVTAGIQQTGVLALAAISGGALVATDQSLILFRFAKGQQTTQTATPFKGARAVATSSAGDLAVVLSACDTTSDGTADADCLTEVAIGASALTPGRQTVLDSTPGATSVALSADGKQAVVADSEVVYGLYLGASPARVSSLKWTFEKAAFTAQPIGLDRAPATVSGQAVELFAAAEKAKSQLLLLAFSPSTNDLIALAAVTLPEAPAALSFGRRTELYVAASKTLYTLDAGLAAPAVSKLEAITPGNAITALSVQP